MEVSVHKDICWPLGPIIFRHLSLGGKLDFRVTELWMHIGKVFYLLSVTFFINKLTMCIIFTEGTAAGSGLPSNVDQLREDLNRRPCRSNTTISSTWQPSVRSWYNSRNLLHDFTPKQSASLPTLPRWAQQLNTCWWPKMVSAFSKFPCHWKTQNTVTEYTIHQTINNTSRQFPWQTMPLVVFACWRRLFSHFMVQHGRCDPIHMWIKVEIESERKNQRKLKHKQLRQ